jgi:magnesium transporter
MEGVINSVAYAEGRRVGDVAISDISEALEQPGVFAWVGLHALAAPTMVAGVYGMNFKFMPELDWRYGYPNVMAAAVAVCVYLYPRFKRSGWL